MIRELSGGDTRGSDSPVLNSVQFLLTGENKALLLLSLSNTHTSPCTSFSHPLCSSLGPELVSQPQRNQFFVFFLLHFLVPTSPSSSSSSSFFPSDVHGPSGPTGRSCRGSVPNPLRNFSTSVLGAGDLPPSAKVFQASLCLRVHMRTGFLQSGHLRKHKCLSRFCTICFAFLFLSLLPQIINKCGGVFSSASETVRMWARVQGRVTLKRCR